MDHTWSEQDEVNRPTDVIGLEKLLRNRWGSDSGCLDEEYDALIEMVVERWAFAARPDAFSRVFLVQVFSDEILYSGFWSEALDMIDRALFYGIATSTVTDEAAALLAQAAHEKGIAKDALFFHGPLTNLAGELANALFAAHRGLPNGETYKALAPFAALGVRAILEYYEGDLAYGES